MVKRKMEKICTFTPKINRKSRYLDEKSSFMKGERCSSRSQSRHEQLYALMMKNKFQENKKRIEKKTILEEREIEECTF